MATVEEYRTLFPKNLLKFSSLLDPFWAESGKSLILTVLPKITCHLHPEIDVIRAIVLRIISLTP